MSHFGRWGPPDISDTYSLLVLNISFRTTPDDLFPLFHKYGNVVDVFIPRDRRSGDSRGFAFVRYKYADEAQKAVDRLDGRMVDGREITVQFAKYGPNAERIHKGRIVEPLPPKRSSRSHRDDYRDRDSKDYRRRSRSRSYDRYDERDRHRLSSRDRDHRHRSSRRYDYDDDHPTRSVDSRSPARRTPTPQRSPSPQTSASPRKKSPRGESPEIHSRSRNTPRGRSDASPRNGNSDVDE